MDNVGKWKCIECGRMEKSSEEDISVLGESWVHLTQVMVPQEASSRWGNSSQEVAARSGNVEGGGSMSEKVDKSCKVPEMCLEDAWETYPLCEECTHKVAAEIREAHDQALQESEMYIQQCEMLSQRLQEEEEESEEDRRKLLREAEQEEEQLLAKSKAIEEAAISVRETVAELEKKGAALQQMHTTYWRDYNDLQLQLRSTDRDSLRRKIEATQAQVETLNQTNVINDAFHIAHTDTYATISGFRLGSVQSQPVDWDEINAAWGQTALLVQTLASHWDFTFPSYRLAPMGSFSRIIKREDDKLVYDLYCPSDIGLSRIFGYGSFDKGMCAFLECVRALQDHVRTSDPTFSPPHRILDHKVEDMSIKLQFNTYEKWTKALKYMLTNIKWLVASSVHRSGPSIFP